jgi:tRNA-dihydrouridine synthase
MNFWDKLKRPIICLAPMADVTDAAFRYIIAKVTKEKVPLSAGFADFLSENTASIETFSFVTYTEFVSADGLVLAPEKGRQKLLKGLEFSEIERPIVAQIFGSKPENIEKAAAMVAELGFDGVDINMGCPDKSIEKQGAGAALMKNTKLAREIIVAAKRGINEVAKNNKDDPCSCKKCGVIPVSVKTRLGYNKDELEEWLPELLAENPAAIIIHARTRKEMSKVPAKWERIKRAVEIRDATHISLQEISLPPTLIIGNGDVENIDDAKSKCEESGADGAMLGRAVFGNPWLFADYEPTNEERIKVLLEHIKLFDEKFNGFKSFAIMKKHFKEYLKKSELKNLRYKMMRTETAKEAEDVLVNFDADKNPN